MLPPQLTAADFRHYPPMARKFAESSLPLFSALPVALLASILREVIDFDWLFPAEQSMLRSQCANLQSLPDEKRTAAIAGFAALTIPQRLSDLDWVNKPSRFLEDLTAYLWSSSQLDAFRAAAVRYASAVETGNEDQAQQPRVCVVVLPADLDKPGYPLFRKLRPHGVFFENIAPDFQEDEILQWTTSRSHGRPERLTHFYVDGGKPLPGASVSLEAMSWNDSAPLRHSLLERVRHMLQTPGAGPEMARTQLSSLTPNDLGLARTGEDDVLDHFLVRVLTEGSGTQIFSTTFVQWSARELLRRAQPATLFLRYGARDQFRPMEVMLSGSNGRVAADPAGSFVDADMGAYYTWINQQRLSGAANARFFAFSAARRQAVAIGPGLARGTFSNDSIALAKVLALLS